MADALEEFRAEARDWLAANFPKALKGASTGQPTDESITEAKGDAATWKKAMGEKGWGVPTWPKEYGGGGLSQPQARVLQQEMSKIGAYNPIAPDTLLGVSMVGPTILDYGTEEQKRKHIPAMARGETRWCVGYSEPNAGSDLASLMTKCEDKGDHWLINGQKIWTSGAHYADWCGALVRTDTSTKHDGISFVLIDMRQKGVETRPILLIAGASPFCETFFTDAKADKGDMLGEINKGWTVGKRLLQHERASQTGAPSGGRGEGGPSKPFQDVAKSYVGTDANGRLADPDMRKRLADHLIHVRAHGLTLQRAIAEAKGTQTPSNAPSVLKNSATVVAQTRAELTLEIFGNRSHGWEGEGFNGEEITAVRSWLSGKAMSIYGGSVEIQNNIISKRILGLPDSTGSA